VSEEPGPADLVRDWAFRVAGCSGTSAHDLLAALGVDGSLVPDLGLDRIDPPPAGTTSVRIRGDVPSLANVEVRTTSTLLLGTLDALLGPRQELPRLHWDSPHVSAYDVVSSAPPGRCTVFARTSTAPAPESVVDSVTLRTEPR
jgi:hypothetical protein